MNLLIVSSAPLLKIHNKWNAYSPYVNELSVWAKYSKISFACVLWKNNRGLLVSELPFLVEEVVVLNDFNLKSKTNFLKAIHKSILNIFVLFKAMQKADHIHLRCPGNIGLLGCIVQVFFPHKKKTAKYAGNWDPKSKQPISYQLQQWILSSTFLTKNMQVLVYGEWTNQSKNIKPFFTATYSETDKKEIHPRNLDSKIGFVFVGTLSEGKRPLYSVQIVEKLLKLGVNATLEIYGEGEQRVVLEAYIKNKNLEDIIFLKGNQTKPILEEAYQKSHFLLLPSKSEGWPKVVAEAMFWGCLPAATPVSCVSSMLDFGERGLLFEMNLEKDTHQILEILNNKKAYLDKCEEAIKWSRKFTIEVFEAEIKKLLQR